MVIYKSQVAPTESPILGLVSAQTLALKLSLPILLKSCPGDHALLT